MAFSITLRHSLCGWASWCCNRKWALREVRHYSRDGKSSIIIMAFARGTYLTVRINRCRVRTSATRKLRRNRLWVGSVYLAVRV